MDTKVREGGEDLKRIDGLNLSGSVTIHYVHTGVASETVGTKW